MPWPGVDRQPELVGAGRAQAQPLEFRRAARAVVGVGVGARVQLDPGRPEPRRRARSAASSGSMKRLVSMPGGIHRRDAGPHPLAVADHVQAALGRHLLAVFRARGRPSRASA